MVEEVKDRAGAVAALKVKASRHCTLNFYNTTPTLYIQGKEEMAFVNEELPRILEGTNDEIGRAHV